MGFHKFEDNDDSERMMEYASKAYKYIRKFMECLEDEGFGERYEDSRYGDDDDRRRDDMGERRGRRRR